MRKLCILIILFAFVQGMDAQPKVNSPYSRFGLGDFFSQDFIAVTSVGGTSASYTDPYHVNQANPASLGYLRATSFDVGVNVGRTRLTEPSQSVSRWSGNLSYLSLAFPLINPINEVLERKQKPLHLGMNVSLMPYTNVGYNIEDSIHISEIGQVSRQYRGSGGTYKVQWNNGLKYKDLAVGLSLQYLFGNMAYTRQVDFPDASSFSDVYDDIIGAKGFLWNAGAMYDIVLDREEAKAKDRQPDKIITVGLTLHSKQSIRTRSSSLYRRVFATSGALIDTIQYVDDVQGDGTLPGGFSAGISYRQGFKWRAGINFASEGWSKYKNSAKPELLQNAWTLSFGIGYRPDINAFNRFLQTIDYRLGVRFGSDPRVYNGDQLHEYAITLGVGVPFFVQRKISFLNAALEYGQFGQPDILKNSYIQLNVGFTLNDDEWFLKRKFN
ncbi:MAG: hypothetical protein KDC28_02205 [Saprospiraceae bacterium]|nr:hypothetical protein [Saprospiraceae bacterium]MCB9320846.1 hypothetical protein [Lewinellaceae bacterium]